jgi:hypothetical protein
MSNVLDRSKIATLLKKDANDIMRSTVRYLHSHPEDLQVMRDAVTNGKKRVYFARRRMWYTITYGIDYDNERTANFQPDKHFIPCGTYRISKLMEENGYV